MSSQSLPANAFPDPNQHRVIERLVKASNAASVAIADLSKPGEPLVIPKRSQAECHQVVIEVPDDKDYPFLNWPYDWTIERVTTLATAGSCTLTLAIDGVPLGGGANAVSTTQQTVTHAAANAVAAGSDLVLTISGNAGAEMLAVTIAGHRNLDTQ